MHDGGRAHFKQKKTQTFFANLNRYLEFKGRKIEIDVHFYPSYKGHNPCDGHTGNIKNQYNNAVTAMREKALDVTIKIAVSIFAKIKNVFPSLLPDDMIDRKFVQEELNMPGITSWHHFKQVDGFLICREISNGEIKASFFINLKDVITNAPLEMIIGTNISQIESINTEEFQDMFPYDEIESNLRIINLDHLIPDLSKDITFDYDYFFVEPILPTNCPDLDEDDFNNLDDPEEFL